MSLEGVQPPPRIIVVDDDDSLRLALRRRLQSQGADVVVCEDGSEVAATIEAHNPEVILLDLHLPDTDGLTLLKEIKATRPEIQVLLMTGEGTVETAVEALQNGAFHYLQKPFADIEVFNSLVRRALDHFRLEERTRSLELELGGLRSLGIIGDSPAMRQVKDVVRTVAGVMTTVLIRGESGTGKEVIARAIHNAGPRREGPFLAINCAALPEQLLESELFGHEKGAFTGASASRKGFFEAAHGGTIFLDELGEMPIGLQAKLLRVLQESEIRRVGSNKTIAVDARVLVATNADLEAAMAGGTFRRDLYFRINVVAIDLPPLRERAGDDIRRLALHFLHRSAKRMERKAEGLTSAALNALQEYTWPGNVRELENAMERAVVFCRGKNVGVEHLAREIAGVGPRAGPQSPVSGVDPGVGYTEGRKQVIERYNLMYFKDALEKCQGDLAEVSRLSKMDRSNLRRLLQRLGLR